MAILFFHLWMSLCISHVHCIFNGLGPFIQPVYRLTGIMQIQGWCSLIKVNMNYMKKKSYLKSLITCKNIQHPCFILSCDNDTNIN